MSKFNIIVRHKINNEVISGDVTFNNLSKMDYDDLDIIVSILYKTIGNKKNNIDFYGLDIFYCNECGHDELVLSVNDLSIFESIYKGLDTSYWRNENIDREKFNKERKDYFKEAEERLEDYELDKDFQVCFKKK
jgi:hypothetical protein